jgi:hypothetical protein
LTDVVENDFEGGQRATLIQRLDRTRNMDQNAVNTDSIAAPPTHATDFFNSIDPEQTLSMSSNVGHFARPRCPNEIAPKGNTGRL